MDCGAVYQRIGRALLFKNQCEVRTTQHNGFGTLFLDQSTRRRIKDCPLNIRYGACGRHRDVGIVHILKIGADGNSTVAVVTPP
jgi:hypothetical protein